MQTEVAWTYRTHLPPESEWREAAEAAAGAGAVEPEMLPGSQAASLIWHPQVFGDHQPAQQQIPAERITDEPPASDSGEIFNAISGAIGAAKAYFGWDATPDEERQKRYELCAACPENDCGKCRLCNCPVGAKIRVASQSCPINKWLAVKKA